MNIGTYFDYNNHIAFIITHTKIGTPHKKAPVTVQMEVNCWFGFRMQRLTFARHLSLTPDFDTSQHTLSAAQTTRIYWTPSIPSTVSVPPSLWNQMLVTAVEHHWTFCRVSVVCRSALWDTRWTTVNYTKDVWMFKVNLLIYYATFSQPTGMSFALLSYRWFPNVN